MLLLLKLIIHVHTVHYSTSSQQTPSHTHTCCDDDVLVELDGNRVVHVEVHSYLPTYPLRSRHGGDVRRWGCSYRQSDLTTSRCWMGDDMSLSASLYIVLIVVNASSKEAVCMFSLSYWYALHDIHHITAWYGMACHVTGREKDSWHCCCCSCPQLLLLPRRT